CVLFALCVTGFTSRRLMRSFTVIRAGLVARGGGHFLHVKAFPRGEPTPSHRRRWPRRGIGGTLHSRSLPISVRRTLERMRECLASSSPARGPVSPGLSR